MHFKPKKVHPITLCIHLMMQQQVADAGERCVIASIEIAAFLLIPPKCTFCTCLIMCINTFQSGAVRTYFSDFGTLTEPTVHF